jgi:hypothetical protein
MTSQEKANELVQQYVINIPLPFHIEDAKICALIAVDEVIASNTNVTGQTINGDYWQEVKQEIEKL